MLLKQFYLSIGGSPCPFYTLLQLLETPPLAPPLPSFSSSRSHEHTSVALFMLATHWSLNKWLRKYHALDIYHEYGATIP